MIRLNRITHGVVKATVLVKLEIVQSRQFHQRPEWRQDDRRCGARRPAEARRDHHRRHLGNTGMGLAIAAVVKGYKCIFTTTDKQSKEKVDALRAFGAEVIVCPTKSIRRSAPTISVRHGS